MSDVSRDEFNDLAERVDRLERQHGALLSLTTEELAGLRVDLRDGLGRLDSVESKLDQYTEQVNKALRAGGEASERHERMMRRLGDHFGVDLGADDD